MTQYETNHKHFDTNVNGRDLICGDLHGCRMDLEEALALIKFDKTVDRLFSVGDLIDRGHHSFNSANLIYEPWFYAVRGNHETLLIDTILYNDREMARTWFDNGGEWRYDHDNRELTVLGRDLSNLPMVISVGEGESRFNIVHSELTHLVETNGHFEPIPVTDQMIDQWDFTEDDVFNMLWSRRVWMLSKGLNPPSASLFHSPLLSLTFTGHSPVREPIMIGKQVFIDTNAVYHYTDTVRSEGNRLTIAEPGTSTLHIFSMMYRTIETMSFSGMLKYQ